MASYVEPDSFDLLPFGPTAEVIIFEATRRTGGNPSESVTPDFVAEVFAGGRVDFSIDEALSVARRWAPELIVNDYLDYVGPLVASTMGIPSVVLAQSTSLPPAFQGALTAATGSRYTDRGLPAPSSTPAGRWLLDPCPPSLQLNGVQPNLERVPLRPETHKAPGFTWSAPRVPEAGAPGCWSLSAPSSHVRRCWGRCFSLSAPSTSTWWRRSVRMTSLRISDLSPISRQGRPFKLTACAGPPARGMCCAADDHRRRQRGRVQLVQLVQLDAVTPQQTSGSALGGRERIGSAA
jgi:hypothetical protein